MARDAVISHWIEAPAAPGILVVGEDMRYIVGTFRDFCSSRNIVLQNAIPVHRESLGPTARRKVAFK